MADEGVELRPVAIVGFLSVLTSLACGGVTPTGGDGGDGIPPSPLTVEVSVSSADMELAALLGWPNGRVPGAEVRVSREGIDGEIEDPIVASTDAEGRAVFPAIFGGTHRVSVLKVLTSAELTILDGTDPLVRALGGGARSVGTTSDAFTVAVQRNRAAGLVVSEISTVESAGTDGIWFGYLELYNNSPDVRFLDGMLIGRAYNSLWESEVLPCSEKQQFSNDPEGVWARLFQRFPGSGGQFPVQPGETVLLAFDAIDHSQNRPWMFDLTNADFEFRTQSDADNPAVPDLIDAGPQAAIQNGIQFIAGANAAFLASPVDPAGLPGARVLSPLSDDVFVRIPTAAVDDVMDPLLGQLNTPAMLCPRTMHPTFSALPYVWKRVPGAHLMSQQRRPVGTAPGGWTILLDTNTSAVDFFEADRTPDAPPPP